MNAFDRVFKPEKQWADIKLTDTCPCNDCAVGDHIRERAVYGSVAERLYIETPAECGTCIRRLHWEMACMQKLAWYEVNDERLKRSK